MSQLDLNRIPTYYHSYVNRVTENNLHDAMNAHKNQLIAFFRTLPHSKWDHTYATGKWSIKEIAQHILDAERIFCYRALCISRKDKTPLPGFDENNYALNAHANKRDIESLMDEIESVVRATSTLFSSFNEEQLQEAGVANGQPTYVTGIGYIIVGHALHHISVIKERYL